MSHLLGGFVLSDFCALGIVPSRKCNAGFAQVMSSVANLRSCDLLGISLLGAIAPGYTVNPSINATMNFSYLERPMTIIELRNSIAQLCVCP